MRFCFHWVYFLSRSHLLVWEWECQYIVHMSNSSFSRSTNDYFWTTQIVEILKTHIPITLSFFPFLMGVHSRLLIWPFEDCRFSLLQKITREKTNAVKHNEFKIQAALGKREVMRNVRVWMNQSSVKSHKHRDDPMAMYFPSQNPPENLQSMEIAGPWWRLRCSGTP